MKTYMLSNKFFTVKSFVFTTLTKRKNRRTNHRETRRAWIFQLDGSSKFDGQPVLTKKLYIIVQDRSSFAAVGTFPGRLQQPDYEYRAKFSRPFLNRFCFIKTDFTNVNVETMF